MTTGDIEVTGEMELVDGFRAKATVKRGGELFVNGLCNGLIVVEAGGMAVVHGVLNGMLIVETNGSAVLTGTANGTIGVQKGGLFSVEEGSKIPGRLDRQ